MADVDKNAEYEQVSADWRHRDNLTWQLPSVLLVVGGVALGTAFDQEVRLPTPIRTGLLMFAAALAWCIFAALNQNLQLQRNDRRILKELYPDTERFGRPGRHGFRRVGSWVFFGISLAAAAALTVVSIWSIWLPFETP